MTNQWAHWLNLHQGRKFNLASKPGWNSFVNTGSRAPLARLSQQELDGLNREEREDYNEARMAWNTNPPTVKTAQVQSAFSIMDQIMASNYRDGDRLRGAVVLDSAPALGKTTIATRYAREFHRKVVRRYGPSTDEGHQRVPVVFIPLDAATTLKGLNQKILSFYGHPGATRATRSRLGALAVDCVRSCETQLIVIDDLHFVDFKHRNGQEVSNHLKGLANEMPVTFIYAGVRLAEKRFFDEGMLGADSEFAQTSRRATRVPVAPFAYTSEASQRAWRQLLSAMEHHLILANSSPGMLTDHARELHRRTQGHIGSLTNLLDRASHIAITTGVECINREVIDAVATDNAAERLSRR